MSYFQCQKCGVFCGVIGVTIYPCACKPPEPAPEKPAAILPSEGTGPTK